MNYRVIYFLILLNSYCSACLNSLSFFLFCCKKKANLNKRNKEKKRFYQTDSSDCDDTGGGDTSLHINNYYQKNPRIFQAEECEVDYEKTSIPKDVYYINKQYKKSRIFEAEASSDAEEFIPSHNRGEFVAVNVDIKKGTEFYKNIQKFFIYFMQ